METLKRKPFQGLINIVRFNWHYFLIALIFISFSFFLKPYFPKPIQSLWSLLIFMGGLMIGLSLLASWYIYDYSPLYRLAWLKQLHIKDQSDLANIHAGLDEFSGQLKTLYPQSNLKIFDFYNPQKHTEISIKRARKAYKNFDGTIEISTNLIPLAAHSVDVVFLFLAAHEIRNQDERIVFFKQLEASLKPDGKIIVTEHLRNISNFIVYSIGAFHFYSNSRWRKVFLKANLKIDLQFNNNFFITTYVLTKSANSS